MSQESSASAMYTDLISTGSLLKALDSCRRSLSPPSDTFTTCLSVQCCRLVVRGMSFWPVYSAAAAQVPTHSSACCAMVVAQVAQHNRKKIVFFIV